MTEVDLLPETAGDLQEVASLLDANILYTISR